MDAGCYTGCAMQCCMWAGQGRGLIKMLHSNKDRKIMALYSDYYQSVLGGQLTSPSKDYSSHQTLIEWRPVEMRAYYVVTAGVKVFHIKRISSRYYGKGEVRKIARMPTRANSFCVENFNFTWSCVVQLKVVIRHFYVANPTHVFFNQERKKNTQYNQCSENSTCKWTRS